MTEAWVRRDFSGTGLTQYPALPHLADVGKVGRTLRDYTGPWRDVIRWVPPAADRSGRPGARRAR
jgi:hypothetical protein